MPYTMTMPKLSPTMEQGVIAKWCKKEGDLVKEGDVILEVATDKATVEHQALDKGYLRKILVPQGQEARVNDPIAIFTETKEEKIEGYVPEGVVVAAAPQAVKAQAAPAQHLEKVTQNARVFASPLAKKLAETQGIDLAKVQGSGPSGRIVARDLGKENKTSLPTTLEKIPFSPMRQVIASRLQESKATIPHFYVTQKIRAERLCALREELMLHGKTVSYNDLVVKGVALALEEHLAINSGCDGKNTLSFPSIDISIAVSTQSGLITPIVFQANRKDVLTLSTTIKELAQKAKEGRLKPQEFQGGSFTISNLGMFGITEFQAIINPPQGAILAVGGILEEPVVEKGEVIPGKTLNLTLSCDHRIIDGTDAAAFLKTLKKILEAPSLLLLTRPLA